MRENKFELASRVRIELACVTIGEQPFSCLLRCGEQEHVAKVHVFQCPRRLTLGAQPPLELHLWIGPVPVHVLPRRMFVFNAPNHLRGNHAVHARNNLIEIPLPAIVVCSDEADALMNELPNFRSVIRSVRLRKLLCIIIVFRRHVPARPAIQFEDVFIHIYILYRGGDLVVVHWVDLAGLAVTLEQFLGDVFTAPEHIDAVKAKEVLLAQVVKHVF
mmetsp:Transcript_33835/g.49742  ORF Transcript_33835/g.49742 Transcript_33835/m.49742 type:complete len:217 (+) Transcript_33835:498-1148(+)